MSRSHIQSLSEATDLTQVGGKAAGLAKLIRHGLPVPTGFVVTVSTFGYVVAGAFAEACRIVDGADVSDPDMLAKVGAEARSMISAVAMPDEIVRELTAHLEACSPEGQPVAVRSSGVGEDGSATSFAGEHDTYLGIRTAGELVEAVRNCWASLFSDRAIAYRARCELAPAPMSVVVQRLVLAESAGVLMTLNPASGDRSLAVVESVWGLGEPVVSGSATPDRFTIDLVTGAVRSRDLANKPSQEIFDGTAVRRVDTPSELVGAASLEDQTLADLYSHVPALKECAGGPADAEFAYDGRLWFVQVRPETYWSRQSAARPRRSTMDTIVSAITTKG